jgi:hypothetical protein
LGEKTKINFKMMYLFKELMKTMGLLILGGLLVAVIISICAFFLLMPGCDNTIYQTIPSPDRRHKVILYSRDCGATTGYSTHISVAKANIDTGFTIFIADDVHGKANLHPVHQNLIDVRVRWINDHSLELSYDKNARLFKEKAQVGGITIVHHKR